MKTILDGVILVNPLVFPTLSTVVVQPSGCCYIEDGEWWVKTPRIYASEYGICAEKSSRRRSFPKGKVMSVYQPGHTIRKLLRS